MRDADVRRRRSGDRRACDRAVALHTVDGEHDIGKVHLTIAYYVPKDRTPLPDWKERVSYYVGRIKAFHERELDGQSTLNITVHPVPLVTTKSSAEVRARDPNKTFFATMDDVRTLLQWTPDGSSGFPILLVLSDINFVEIDDFQRTFTVDGKTDRCLPLPALCSSKTETGGSRAGYYGDYGMGLVSGAGWRVPRRGADCVVYGDGLGRPLGLGHPDPLDKSVTGLAQYHFALNETWLADSQKATLGWTPRTSSAPPTLFSAFTTRPEPIAPRPDEPVLLKLTWPPSGKLRSLTVRVQTELFGPWRTITVPLSPVDAPPRRVSLGTFERVTPVSYRVEATLEDGQSVEEWGYFQVDASAAPKVESIGHYDDTDWMGLDDVNGYEDITVDITIEIWEGSKKTNDGYYYANYATFTNGAGVYGGLQTNGFDGEKFIGKMALFSVWNTYSGIAEPGGTGVKFGGEGTGYSVRIPFNWSVGTTYRFKMYIDRDASSGQRTWAASLTDLSSGKTTRIGRIHVPASFGKIRRPITFHERDRGDTTSCNRITASRVRFAQMTANRGSVKAQSGRRHGRKTVPECPSVSWVQDQSDGYVSGVHVPQPTAAR
jgi:hypothetical protein